MKIKIYPVEDRIFVQGEEGGWGEVSPLVSRNKETLDDCLEQLKSVQDGWRGNLFPSVAFALESARHPFKSLKWPVCYLFMGTEKEIMRRRDKAKEFTHAKLKVGDFSVEEAVRIAKNLKDLFRLRLDFNGKWKAEDVRRFCSYFNPHDFEFLEDPGIAVEGFTLAADDSSLGEIPVWKPTVKGVPKANEKLILSSAWESGVGIASIAALAERLKLPPHPIGIGTYFYLQDDLLEEPLQFEEGCLVLTPSIKPRAIS